MSDQDYNYGKCHVCGAQMVEKQVSQDYWIKGDLIVIENVPSGVCTKCGERVVKADVGKQIASLLAEANQLQPTRSINVPVFEFKAAA